MHRKNVFKLFIKLALSGAIMAVLISRLEVESFSAMIHRFSPLAWLGATGFIMVQFLLITYRWNVLINIGMNRMNYRQSLEVTVASLVANSLFIAAITGVFVKIAMSLHYGASLFKSFVATVIDRLLTLAALLFLSSLFLPLLGQYLKSDTHGDLYHDICIYMGIMIFVTFILAPVGMNLMLKHMNRLPFSLRHIRNGTRYMKILLNNKSILARVAVSSLIAQFSFFVSVYVIALSTDIDLPFIDMMTVLPLITLVASLPISFGGWGVREGAFMYGFALLGVPMETSFLISVQTGLIGLLVTILLGLPILLTSSADFTKLPAVPNLKRAIFNR